MLRVEAIVSVDELKPYFDSNTETYIIDRASNRSIFLSVNKVTHTSKVVEVASDSIQGIAYSVSP